jgi:hypothetical protein
MDAVAVPVAVTVAVTVAVLVVLPFAVTSEGVERHHTTSIGRQSSKWERNDVTDST